MIIETVSVGSMQVNCYIVAESSGGHAVIIDPGDEEGKIRKIIVKDKLKPVAIINTHGHIDHIGADNAFGIPVYAHRLEIPLMKNPQLNLSDFLQLPYSLESEVIPLEDKEKLVFGNLELEVIHTPGHTAGGISLSIVKPGTNILFTGDTLFCQSVGRTDFSGADHAILIRSIKERLLCFPDDTVIYPGHGPSSTIGKEKKKNPFLAG